MSGVGKRARTEPPTPEPWMTLQEAADMLGVTRHKVLMRALNGELVTQKIARWVFVSRESVERALAAVQ